MIDSSVIEPVTAVCDYGPLFDAAGINATTCLVLFVANVPVA